LIESILYLGGAWLLFQIGDEFQTALETAKKIAAVLAPLEMLIEDLSLGGAQIPFDVVAH
jgi:hypothetical protein